MCEPQKLLELLSGGRHRPIRYCLNLPGVLPNLTLLNEDSQELYRSDVELTFLRLNEELILQQSLQDQADMCSWGFWEKMRMSSMYKGSVVASTVTSQQEG